MWIRTIYIFQQENLSTLQYLTKIKDYKKILINTLTNIIYSLKLKI
jgi:hypothetical protein